MSRTDSGTLAADYAFKSLYRLGFSLHSCNGRSGTASLTQPAENTFFHIPHNFTSVFFGNVAFFISQRQRQQISKRLDYHKYHLSVQHMHGSMEAAITGTSARDEFLIMAARMGTFTEAGVFILSLESFFSSDRRK